jgi:hypothetical protein
VGDADGFVEGASLGEELGEARGSNVGIFVGECVGIPVGDNVSRAGVGVVLLLKEGLEVISSTVGDMVIP